MTKTFITDLDGTFLNDQHQFDRALFADVLAQIEAQAGHFIVASGRDYKMAAHVFAGFEERISFAVDNGATIKTADGQLNAVTAISPAGLLDLQSQIDQMGNYPADGAIAVTTDKIYSLTPVDDLIAEFRAIMTALYGEFHRVETLQDIAEPVIKASLFYGNELNDKFINNIRAVNGAVHATTPGFGVVDIMAQGINKAVSVKKIMAHYGADPAQSYAFGDGMNDLEMLQLIAHPHKMPVADERLLDLGFATAIAGHNESGVLKTIQQILAQ
ncbi:MAG: HAD-IIB family hydrolase [Lactobacillaceae bacterium]|jgi:Cof subfamily protein (haloacid dehalogenase superfamily)|nr:HAD-IIB family hydrolase [Lactobacillaceae bacterium]